MDPNDRSYIDSITWLWNAGLRFGSVIDLGCADGHFSVHLAEQGPARDSVILNVDALEDYRDSLTSIQAELGGHFRICAVAERDGGTLELQRGAHAYWTSARPQDDRYWASVNGLLSGKTVRAPLRSLDSLVEETTLPGPYVLKMDVQGAEAAILAGGRNALARTDVVVVEILVEDFAAIHQGLAQNDFSLFDVTGVRYADSGALAWFYATYLKSRHSALRPARHWNPARNDEVLAAQVQRREFVQNTIWASLDRRRSGEWPPLPDKTGPT